MTEETKVVELEAAELELVQARIVIDIADVGQGKSTSSYELTGVDDYAAAIFMMELATHIMLKHQPHEAGVDDYAAAIFMMELATHIMLKHQPHEGHPHGGHHHK